MQCAFERSRTQPNAVRIRAQTQPVCIRTQPNPTKCGVHSSTAKPNRMQCAFKRSRTQPNAVHIRAQPNPTECSADLSAAKPNQMRCAFEHGQTQPNAVRIRARPNPTKCGVHSNTAKPNQMQCAFERDQTNPGHHAASASWGSHFCPLKTKVLLNGCPMHAMKAMNKGYRNHHGQHKSVQKWVCKPAFIIWLVPGVLPSKWDDGTSHAIFRFRFGGWDVPYQKMHGTSHAKNHNSWDVPSWMGHPLKKHPP
ncbi:hypothetical protein K438DRAFT_1765367 [Mycena galopus ATCC 62051]|nr:hypothetical protein K438DRAFT_1765367 [Mycena galopus ATCC 62051]